MSQVYPQAFMDELKAKNDIVTVVSRYVSLERKGRLFWGKCPFHGEKTPSFAVNDEEQFFHCFGCKESGDVIKFVQKIESLDFVDAIKLLADWAHLEVPSLSGKDTTEETTKRKKQCLAALKETALFYYNNLTRPEAELAKKYLDKRGISDGLAKRFGLGFSVGYYDIINHLKKLGYTDEILLDAGITKIKDSKAYDAVGNRLIFPILNVFGEVVAFSGRTLEQKPDFAKYLNTAETCVFSKSKNLYAINLLKKKKLTTQVDYVIVVEGNVDVISLHKAGFDNTVASMGTALTIEQAKLLKRFSNDIYICYDGDTAGKKATLRGLDILKEQGLNVKVVSLPDGMDPDDVINKQGKSAYQKLLDEALPLVEFKLTYLKKQFDLTSLDGKTKYVEAALKVLSDLSSEVEKETYLSFVQEASGINRDFLKRQIEHGSVSLDLDKKAITPVKPVEKQEIDDAISKAEKFILASLLFNKEYAKIDDINENMFIGNEKLVFEFEKNNPLAKPTEMFDTLGNLDGLVGELITFNFSEISNIKLAKRYDDCLLLIKRNALERRQKELNEQITNEISREKRQELLIELDKITKERKQLWQ